MNVLVQKKLSLKALMHVNFCLLFAYSIRYTMPTDNSVVFSSPTFFQPTKTTYITPFSLPPNVQGYTWKNKFSFSSTSLIATAFSETNTKSQVCSLTVKIQWVGLLLCLLILLETILHVYISVHFLHSQIITPYYLHKNVPSEKLYREWPVKYV